MKCVKCKNKAEIKVQNLEVCSSCFLKIIQKRVRKEIRLKRLIRENDSILVIDDGSAESQVSLYLLKSIVKNMPVSISTRKESYRLGDEIRSENNKIIIPWNADKEDEYFLGCIFDSRKPVYIGHFRLKGKTYIKPLLPVLHREAEIFASIKNFRYRKKEETSAVSEMLDRLEEEYPEIRFSLLKSTREV